METTRLSSKGQVVLPKSVRTAHGWKPGTEFVIEDRDGGVLLRPRKPTATRWEDIVGITGYRGPRKTLREMDDAIEAEAGRHK